MMRTAARFVLALLLLGLGAGTASAQEPTGQPVVYVVQEGDTLTRIAQLFGVTVEEIVAANGISDPARIAVGQELIIPQGPASQGSLPGAEPLPEAGPSPEAPSEYVVEPGDTLSGIAQRFGITVEALAEANGIADPTLIVAGQKLIIPTGQPAPQPAAAGPAIGRLHRVRKGEALPSLAFRYGTTAWALSAANGLNRLGILLPEQEIQIPAASIPSATTPVPPDLAAWPGTTLQGQTVTVKLSSRGELALYGTVMDRDLRFYEDGPGLYYTLFGVPADVEPGGYPLTVWARELSTGDLLTIEGTLQVEPGSFSVYDVRVPTDRLGLLDPAVTQPESTLVDRAFGRLSQPRRWEGPFALPLAGEPVTTAPFGQRRSYAGGPVSSYHTGHDYRADSGTRVYAPAGGTVVLAEALQVRGQAIVLDHGSAVLSGFWHLSRIDVQVGQAVQQGDLLGLVGNTGLSTGPHLHWEIRVGGVPVDPLQWAQQVFP